LPRRLQVDTISPVRLEGMPMRRMLPVIVAALGAAAFAADSPIDARAERLAKMAHAIDVREAMGYLEDCETVARTAPSRRNPAFSKVAREEVKAAKKRLAEARERGPKHYMERARLAAAANGLNRPDPDAPVPNMDALSPGEAALERMRFAGPVSIGGVHLGRNSIGTPRVTVGVQNWSDRTVEAVDFEIECWNSFDEPVKADGVDNVMRGTFQRPIEAGQFETPHFDLAIADTTTRVSVRITRIKPEFGVVWDQTREEAERSPGAIVQAKMRQ
jgi:hypothetical protein